MLGSLRRLRDDRRLKSPETLYDTSAQVAAALKPGDGREALAVVQLNGDGKSAQNAYPTLRGEVGRSAPLTVHATGDLAVTADGNQALGNDLMRAGLLAVVATAILLLVVLGTVVGAALPLGVGTLKVVGGVSAAFVLGRFIDISQYATAIIALIGLGVGVDYSLFIISRYREQLRTGSDPQQSLAVAMSTAGRPVIFSGLAVAVGLSSLLFFQGSYLATMGLAAGLAVGAAVLYAFTSCPHCSRSWAPESAAPGSRSSDAIPGGQGSGIRSPGTSCSTRCRPCCPPWPCSGCSRGRCSASSSAVAGSRSCRRARRAALRITRSQPTFRSRIRRRSRSCSTTGQEDP